MADLIDAEQLRRRLESAWEAGFYAGQSFGAASERHDPQWDMGPPPGRPENPYRLNNPAA